MIKDEVEELTSYILLYRAMGYHETFVFRYPTRCIKLNLSINYDLKQK